MELGRKMADETPTRNVRMPSMMKIHYCGYQYRMREYTSAITHPPAFQATSGTNSIQATSEKAAECTRQRCGGVENTNA
jgi:hypothetical protein